MDRRLSAIHCSPMSPPFCLRTLLSSSFAKQPFRRWSMNRRRQLHWRRQRTRGLHQLLELLGHHSMLDCEGDHSKHRQFYFPIPICQSCHRNNSGIVHYRDHQACRHDLQRRLDWRIHCQHPLQSKAASDLLTATIQQARLGRYRSPTRSAKRWPIFGLSLNGLKRQYANQ